MTAQSRGGTDLRALKALVGGMGVLIFLGTAVVVGVVVQRIYARPAAPSMVQPVVQSLQRAPFLLPAGAHIAGVAAAGGAIAVWITGAVGDEVLLVNPTTGAVTKVLSGRP